MKKYGKRDFHRDMEKQKAHDERLRQLTFAMFRQLGRVRVNAESIAGLDPRDKVSMQTDEATGDVVVTYEAATSEDPLAPPRVARH